MKEYCVTIPICGYAVVVVEAEDEEDAKTKAIEGDITLDDIEEWEALEHICEGNCFNGPLNDIEVEEQ